MRGGRAGGMVLGTRQSGGGTVALDLHPQASAASL